MTLASRLDAQFPQLAALLDKATPSQRKNAALLACEHALDANCTGISAVEAAWGCARRGQPAPSDVIAALTAARDEADSAYMANEDDSDAARVEAIRHFSKARASSALLLVLSSVRGNELQEAIYEALMALDDTEPLIAMMTKVLRAD